MFYYVRVDGSGEPFEGGVAQYEKPEVVGECGQPGHWEILSMDNGRITAWKHSGTNREIEAYAPWEEPGSCTVLL